MIESDADRLTLIQAVGEQFETGHATKLWAIYDREYAETATGRMSTAGGRALIHCRTSDIELHSLVRDSKLTRADGSVFFAKSFEPDGVGMTIVVLSQ